MRLWTARSLVETCGVDGGLWPFVDSQSFKAARISSFDSQKPSPTSQHPATKAWTGDEASSKSCRSD